MDLGDLFDHAHTDLGAVLNRLDIGVALAGVESSRFLRINAAACRILGRSEAELVGTEWDSLVTRADREGLVRAAAELASGEISDLQRQVVKFVRPDGSLVYVLFTATIAPGPTEPLFVFQLLDCTEREQANHNLQLVLERSPVSLLLLDPTGRVLFIGGGLVKDVVGRLKAAGDSTIFDLFPGEQPAFEPIRDAMHGTPSSQVVTALGRHIDLYLMPVNDSDGSVSSVAAVVTDVSDRERAQAEVRARSAEQSVVADIAQRALDTLDPDLLWHHAVEALADQLDAAVTMHESSPDGAGSRLIAAVGPDPPPEAAAISVPVGRPGAATAVVEIRRHDALNAHEADFVHAVGSVLGSAAVRFAMEREIRYRSLHDDLTGLPNRAALLERLAQSLEQARQSRRRTGLVFVDLDGFKNVNDTLGHLAGDELLREAADRLRRSVRPDDVVARLAGDEFAVLCQQVLAHSEVERVAQRVVAALAEPFNLGGTEVMVTASAGVALSGTELADADRLLNASDFAMYAAKRAGAGRFFVHQASAHFDTAAVDGDSALAP